MDQKKDLDSKLDEVRELESACNKQKINLQKQEYNFYFEILSKSFLENDYIVAMERNFWEDTLLNLMCIGKQLGKKESEIKKRLVYI